MLFYNSTWHQCHPGLHDATWSVDAQAKKLTNQTYSHGASERGRMQEENEGGGRREREEEEWGCWKRRRFTSSRQPAALAALLLMGCQVWSCRNVSESKAGLLQEPADM